MKAMLVGAAAAVAVAGCGSQEASVLQTALKHPIKSANVSMKFDMSTSQTPVQVSLTGPYQSNGEGKLPDLDWQMHFAYGPQSLNAEFISTGENAFVKYDGKTYEVGKATIAKLQRKSAQTPGMASTFNAADLSRFLRKARDWFADTGTQQDAQLDGEAVTRVTGRLDLSKALKDIGQIAGAGQAIPQAQIQKLDKLLSDPRFTVDVGKNDGKLRRILATVQIRGQGGVRLELRYSDVDKPVTINAPSSGLPLSQLEKKFQHDFGGSSTSSGSGSSA